MQAKVDIMTPRHINPAQWQHALTVARQTCGHVFRDGGAPCDAMEAFGIVDYTYDANWKQAVEAIACALCETHLQRAA